MGDKLLLWGRGAVFSPGGAATQPKEQPSSPLSSPPAPGVIAGGLVGLIFAVCLVGFMLYQIGRAHV